MNFRYALNWSIWISVISAIYVYAYSATPLYLLGTLPCTFISLPIFFTAGAKGNEFLDYLSSAIAGVAWAAVLIMCIEGMDKSGLSESTSLSIVVFLVTTVLCTSHFLLANMGYCTKIPMIFGTVGAIFLMGLPNWPAVLVTLFGGLILGWCCQAGTRFLDSSGRWTRATPSQSPAR